MSRSDYWFDGVIARGFAFVMAALMTAAVVGVVVCVIFGVEHLEFALWACQLVFAVTYLWPESAITVKRLHDHDRSGWWALALLVPFLNLWVWVTVAFLAGTRGENRFGPDPVR
jgi:uncharacterized membrane protein YhaH (DUF805 family)